MSSKAQGALEEEHGDSMFNEAKAYFDMRFQDVEKLIIETSDDRSRSNASQEPTRSKAEPQEARPKREEIWQDLSAMIKRQVGRACLRAQSSAIISDQPRLLQLSSPIFSVNKQCWRTLRGSSRLCDRLQAEPCTEQSPV
jgi:FtsZ-interacting cell division protein YlmF